MENTGKNCLQYLADRLFPGRRQPVLPAGIARCCKCKRYLCEPN